MTSTVQSHDNIIENLTEIEKNVKSAFTNINTHYQLITAVRDAWENIPVDYVRHEIT